jgi:hypothetical protein
MQIFRLIRFGGEKCRKGVALRFIDTSECIFHTGRIGEAKQQGRQFRLSVRINYRCFGQNMIVDIHKTANFASAKII